jgi:hypothetical protein
MTLLYQTIGFVLPTVFIVLDITQHHISQDALDHIVEKKQESYQYILTRQIRSRLGIRPYLNSEATFALEISIALSVAFMLILAMSCGLYEGLNKQAADTMHSEDYVEELATVYALKARSLQPAHRRVKNIKVRKSVAWAFMWSTTKLLTVPILIRLYSLIDCPYGDDGFRRLSLMPEIICFKGNHLYAVVFCGIIVLTYIARVIPFSFVGCDADVWFSFSSMRDLFRNAAINAMKVDVAFLTPGGINWCINGFSEFVMKATLPAVMVLENQNHMLRSAMITAVFFMETLVAILRPPFRHPDANLVCFSLKLVRVSFPDTGKGC